MAARSQTTDRWRRHLSNGTTRAVVPIPELNLTPGRMSPGVSRKQKTGKFWCRWLNPASDVRFPNRHASLRSDGIGELPAPAGLVYAVCAEIRHEC